MFASRLSHGQGSTLLADGVFLHILPEAIELAFQAPSTFPRTSFV